MTSFVERLSKYQVCVYCQSLYLGIKFEQLCQQSMHTVFAECERRKIGLEKTTSQSENESINENSSQICVNCWDLLQPKYLDKLVEQIHLNYRTQFPLTPFPSSSSPITLIENDGSSTTTIQESRKTIQMELSVPDMLDIPRIVFRTYLTNTTDKVLPFTTVDCLIRQYLISQLQSRWQIEVVTEGDYIVQIDLSLNYQRELLQLYYAPLTLSRAMTSAHNLNRKIEQLKTNKRKREESDQNSSDQEITPNLTRSEIDQYLVHFKEEFQPSHHQKLLIERCANLIEAVNNYFPTIFSCDSDAIIEFSASNLRMRFLFFEYRVDSYFPPIYILGRYRKFARDVPQSPWSLTPISVHSQSVLSNLGTEECDIGMDEEEGDRKGRFSVEEIIASYFYQTTHCRTCTLHGCGREDIDVRCLGNGRPFCLQIGQSRRYILSDLLEQISKSINAQEEGLNQHGDILVSHLSVTTVGMWERMQVEAEEKKKGYCCVLYSSSPITKQKLQNLEVASKQDRDDDNQQCLKIIQKTPLRVMHRRSLLDRVKYVYEIETCSLNAHYFLMKLVTSAGTYVKEFVHSDFGRTTPSVKSILGCRVEILQLDVIWLFDSIHPFVEKSDVIEPDLAPDNSVALVKERERFCAKLSWGVNILNNRCSFKDLLNQVLNHQHSTAQLMEKGEYIENLPILAITQSPTGHLIRRLIRYNLSLFIFVIHHTVTVKQSIVPTIKCP